MALAGARWAWFFSRPQPGDGLAVCRCAWAPSAKSPGCRHVLGADRGRPYGFDRSRAPWGAGPRPCFGLSGAGSSFRRGIARMGTVAWCARPPPASTRRHADRYRRARIVVVPDGIGARCRIDAGPGSAAALPVCCLHDGRDGPDRNGRCRPSYSLDAGDDGDDLGRRLRLGRRRLPALGLDQPGLSLGCGAGRLRRAALAQLSHFLTDGPDKAGVAPPPLLSKAPKIAAALSRPVPWPPVDTTVCGTSRPISETTSGFSWTVFRSCWTRVIVSTRSCPSTSACARCPWAISSSSSFWPSPRSFAAFLFCSET